jgi:hypothetical protein
MQLYLPKLSSPAGIPTAMATHFHIHGAYSFPIESADFSAKKLTTNWNTGIRLCQGQKFNS